MSEPCSIEMCKSSSRTQCYCCQKNFCRSHFIEHGNLLNLQLDVLAGKINSLNDRLLTFNVDEIAGNSRPKLEQWRANCHQMVDDAFEDKCREIDRRANEKLEQQRSEISKMVETVTELHRKQETTMKDIDSLETAIHTTEEKINTMEQTRFEVVVRPLVIDHSLIRIKELYMCQFDLSSLPPPYKTIDHVYDSSLVIASNDQFLLIHQKSDLCLVDRELVVINKKRWDYGLIYAMCWSSTLARFFIMTAVNVFMMDDNIMCIEKIQINQNQRWFSCTCSDTTLYLSTWNTGSSILTFDLSPAVQFQHRWISPETCTKDQMIICIVYNNETLAIVIVDPPKKDKWIELRSAATFGRLWSFLLDIEGGTTTRCCSLNHGDWLAWNCYTSSLFHITNDGKLQATSKYKEIFHYVVVFDGGQLAISTDKGINLHRIKSDQKP